MIYDVRKLYCPNNNATLSPQIYILVQLGLISNFGREVLDHLDHSDSERSQIETNVWTGVANALWAHQRIILVFISRAK